MNMHRSIFATALSIFAFANVAAQDAPTPPPSERPPPRAEAPPPTESQKEEPRTLEEIFIPSDEIAADEEVTFPIDI